MDFSGQLNAVTSTAMPPKTCTWARRFFRDRLTRGQSTVPNRRRARRSRSDVFVCPRAETNPNEQLERPPCCNSKEEHYGEEWTHEKHLLEQSPLVRECFPEAILQRCGDMASCKGCRCNISHAPDYPSWILREQRHFGAADSCGTAKMKFTEHIHKRRNWMVLVASVSRRLSCEPAKPRSRDRRHMDITKER